MSLNNSTWYKGEDIEGQLTLTVLPADPLSAITDLTGTTFQLIVKSSKDDLDSQALADLSLGNGLTLISGTADTYLLDFLIPGSATENLTPATTRDSVVKIEYEINATYPGRTYSDVLEVGTIKVETHRILSTLSTT